MTAESPGSLDVPALLLKLGVLPRRITADSRRVEPGVAFAAYPGARADGRLFVADAVARGAAAVLWETRSMQWEGKWTVPNLGVDGLQARLGYIADFIYGSPSQRLWMIGVTGTNGKTSCAQWIARGARRVRPPRRNTRDARQRSRRRVWRPRRTRRPTPRSCRKC